MVIAAKLRRFDVITMSSLRNVSASMSKQVLNERLDQWLLSDILSSLDNFGVSGWIRY